MNEHLCPNCFAYLDRRAFLCATPGCEKNGIPVEPGQNGETPVCEACRRPMSARACPKCGYEFGGEVKAAAALPISIIGASSSGKSNYLAVLVEQLGAQMGKAYRCSLFPVGTDVDMEHYRREYRRPLFEQGRCIASTQQDSLLPIRLALTFSGERPAGASCQLTLYDACGANFENEKRMAEYNRSIYNSKGLIYFIDPTQLPEIRERHRVKGRPVVAEDPHELLVRTVRLIRSERKLTDLEQKIDIPLAVCLSKLDTLADLLDPASFVGAPGRHLLAPRLDGMDLHACSLEVQSLMASWGGGKLLSLVKSQFKSACYFGLSSLGGQPGPDNYIPRLSPHRVLDPVLWLLWKNSVLRRGRP